MKIEVYTLLGEHNTCFYESENVKHEILFSNLMAGADNGCSLLYISNGEETEDVKEELLNFGLKVDNPSSLKIVKNHEWYTPDGVLDANRIIEQCKELIHESSGKGSKGLYISADVADVFDCFSSNLESLLKLEKSFGRVFNLPVAAICAYRLNQALFSSEVFLQLVQAHKKTITPTTFINNKFACFKTIIEVLNNLFGEHTTKIIFSYLEQRFRISPDQIPDRMEDFQRSLEQIYNRDIANRIIDRISKDFILKELQTLRGYR